MNIRAFLVLGIAVLGLGVTAPPAKAQTFVRTIGSGPGSGNGQLNGPIGVAVDTANGSNVLVADSSNNRVEVFSAAGAFIRTIGSGPGSGNGQFSVPYGVAIDTANGSNVLVADRDNNRIEVFSAAGSFIRTIGSGPGSGNGQLSFPIGIAVDAANGTALVVDFSNTRIEVFRSGDPLPVPALGTWGVLLSALLLAGAGYFGARRSLPIR